LSSLSNSSNVKSEGNNKNRAISLSFELILQILCKSNYFLVTNQIFLQKNVIFLFEGKLFSFCKYIYTERRCLYGNIYSHYDNVLVSIIYIITPPKAAVKLPLMLGTPDGD